MCEERVERLAWEYRNAGGPCLKLESLSTVAMKRLHLPLNMAGATISFYVYFFLQSIVRNVVAYASMRSCCTQHRPSVTSMPPSNLALRQVKCSH